MRLKSIILSFFILLLFSCATNVIVTKQEAFPKMYNEKPLSVELPNQVQCKIEKTDVALKGQTVSSSYKPATLENGIKIMVPPFINSDDKIVLDTRTLEYIKKVK